VKEQLELLIKFQMFDVALVRAQKIKEDHPHQTKHIEEAVERERKELQTQEKQVEEIKKKRIQKDQYHAALKEIEVLESHNSILEETILLVMEQSDQGTRNLHSLETRFKQTLKKAEEDSNALNHQLEEALKEIEAQQQLREALVAQIAPELLDQYHKIRQKRGDPVVVPVEDSCCQGCHMNIKCPHCSRILYWVKNHESVSLTSHPHPQ
jgi:predicted  nucleic acid-binding Zn-ribbon protein